jgi:hypothetical protein
MEIDLHKVSTALYKYPHPLHIESSPPNKIAPPHKKKSALTKRKLDRSRKYGLEK